MRTTVLGSSTTALTQMTLRLPYLAGVVVVEPPFSSYCYCQPAESLHTSFFILSELELVLLDGL